MLSQNRQLILCAWSSSEYDYGYAWGVYADSGGVNSCGKSNFNGYVRCVLAFWNKAIIQNICRNSTDYGLLECAGFILKRAVDSRVQETRPGVKQKNGQLILCAWSSSENNDGNAWLVYASDGHVNLDYKNDYGYVRCVLAFWDKTNMSVFILPELAGLRSGRVSIFYFQKGCRQPGEETRRLLSQNRQLILCAWSSSEYSNNNAWNVNGSNGWLNNGNNKANNAFYVRCVLALGNKI